MNKNNIKIAFIGQKGIPAQQGGIETHTEELATRLAKADFDISVYSRPYYTKNTKKNYIYKGVKIINLPSIRTKHLDAITHTFISTIHALTQGYDIIHYHGVGPSLLSWLPRIFSPRTKVIATFHCVDRNHQKWGAFAKFMLFIGEWSACHFPHRTITISRALKLYCQMKFNHDAVYIPNCVNAKEETANTALKDFGLTKNNYIVTISRLIKHKGVHTLIKAYQKLNTSKKLVIVGDSVQTDGYVKELKDLAKDNKNIIFTGQKTGSDLISLFKNAYLFVQPSESEGLSISLLEAMAYGVPIIISDIEENHEALANCGLEFKNKSVNDLSRQISFAIKHPQYIRKMATLAKIRAKENYNWEDAVKYTIDVYNEAINKTSEARKTKRVMKASQI